MRAQQTLKQDPFSGHLFAFRGKKASMLKILFWDGNGLCLFTKRLGQGSLVWPVMAGFDGSIQLQAWDSFNPSFGPGPQLFRVLPY